MATYEIWTKNEAHYILADGAAIAWSDDYNQMKKLCDRMINRYLPMIREFKTFLPVVWR